MNNRLNFKLKTIEINNYKGVDHGILDVVEFRNNNFNTSGITAIFGENASGKSSICECLKILKNSFPNNKNSIWNNEDECIDIALKIRDDSVPCFFSYTFDVFDEKKLVNTLTYKIEIQKTLHPLVHEIPIKYLYNHDEDDDSYRIDTIENINYTYIASLYKETFIASGIFDGVSIKQQEILSYNHKSKELSPIRKHKIYMRNVKDKKDFLFALSYGNRVGGTSILMDDKFQILQQGCGDSDYINLINEFRMFILNSLYVLDEIPHTSFDPTKISECCSFSLEEEKMKLYRYGYLPGYIYFSCENYYKEFIDNVEKINKLLPLFIPNISISTETLNDEYVTEVYDDGYRKSKIQVKISSNRNGNAFPIQYESEGTKKIINLIEYYVEAYKNSSALLVVDEFDFALHEYLLQILLQVFNNGGKGQLLFTSHNLRPLEVLDKQSIVFTTTDSKDRFCRFNNIRNKNNLRDCYYDEITYTNNVKRKKQEHDFFNKININDIEKILNS